MQIRMIETFMLEADSIEEAEQAYMEGVLYEMTPEFISVGFTEEKETEEKETEEKEKEMDKITISIEKFEELVRKAHSFDLLKKNAENEKYPSTVEKILFGLDEKPEETEEDDF